MHTIRVSVMIAVLMCAAAGAAAPVLNSGRWELTIRTEAPVATPPQITEICLSKQAAEKPEPPRGKPTDDCKLVSGGLSGNVLAYVMKCSKRETSSKFTYNGDQYEGVIEIKGEGETVRQVITARRIGDCPEESSAPARR
jgi:Protein of unknown function (DUF3617)